MSIPTYQVFNVDKESTENCGGGKSGYIRRTNYLLDSFRKRDIVNSDRVKDEGERQYDGSYNLEQQQQPRQSKYDPSDFVEKEGFLNFNSLSPLLIVITVSSLLIFIYIIYKIMTKRNKKIEI